LCLLLDFIIELITRFYWTFVLAYDDTYRYFGEHDFWLALLETIKQLFEWLKELETWNSIRL
jgi:hypothetical protein